MNISFLSCRTEVSNLPADLSGPDVAYVDIEVRFSAAGKHSSEHSLDGFATIISSKDLVLDLKLHLLRL